MFTLPCDENGELCGTIINSNYYHYIKNIFGDILGLVDEDGGYVADYTYDAWGNILSATASINNSIRYKGYYYDSETDMYYCHTRYYVPKWLRWLNSDNVEYLDTDDFAGINLFVYCGNNPVIYMDEDGCSRKSNWIKGFASGLMIAGGIALCFVPGAQVFGAALIITGAGGLIGGGISAATGGDFGDGWNIGTAIGAAVGLAIIAPEVIPYVSKLTIPILGLAETSAGISIVVTGTVALTIPTGLIAWGASVFAAGYMFAKTGKSNGYYAEKYLNDHNPPHAHFKGTDGSDVRIDPNGNPIEKRTILTPQQRKAIKHLIEEIRKLF